MHLPPDIVRSAYAELVVTDLDRARWFWVDVLGFVPTAEGPGALYLRGYDELTHHNLILRNGAEPGASRLAFRVRSGADLERAAEFYARAGCRTERVPAGETTGVGEAVRAEDPLGFTVEFFHKTSLAERRHQRYDLRRGAEVARLDHFNIVVPDVRAAYDYYKSLGFGLSETIEDGETLYAAWMYRKQTVHDVAFTGGAGPRLHHLGFFAHEPHQVLRICDILGSLHQEDHIERGPGRHGVSNAFYVYLRDPDGHRLEIYTSDYYTGDPDHPVLRWDVRDPRRRDFWGNAVVPSWYAEATTVLDLDGKVRPVAEPDQAAEVTVGADGFTAPPPPPSPRRNGARKSREPNDSKRESAMSGRVRSELLLVGSLPVDSDEAAFRAGAMFFGDLVFALPDGETGPRAGWVGYERRTLAEAHPDLELVPGPTPTADAPRHVYDIPVYTVRADLDQIRFDTWPRINDAIASYAVFGRLRDEGVIPRGVRFQIGLPFPESAMSMFRENVGRDYPIAARAYEDLVARELSRLLEAIPADDLAIQWDIAFETKDIEGVLPWMPEGGWERFAGPVRRLTPLIPGETLVGYHLCQGTLPEWPMYEPQDMSVLVRMANYAVAESGRQVDWLHMAGPRVLRSEDKRFFRPLADLEPRGARVFLGLVQPVDGVPGLLRRHDTAKRYLDDFGVAMYCGFGRQPGQDGEETMREHRETVLKMRDI